MCSKDLVNRPPQRRYAFCVRSIMDIKSVMKGISIGTAAGVACYTLVVSGSKKSEALNVMLEKHSKLPETLLMK